MAIDGAGMKSAANADGFRLQSDAPSATNPNILPSNSDGDTGIGRAGNDALSLIAGGVEGLRVEGNKISGSSTSTGSFGSMVIGGQNNANAQAGADTLVVQDGMTIFNTGTGRLNFSDGAGSGDESYKGVIKYNHATNILTFAANAVDRVSLNPSGVLQTLHVSGSSTSTCSIVTGKHH